MCGLLFAVAAHLEPDILIIDEVLAVGDAEFQKKCIGKMKDVSEQEGRTVLYVSHNMPSILKLCNRVVVLQNGRQVFSGDTEEGVSEYLHQKANTVSIELSERKDRKGNGFIRCTAVEVLNERFEQTESVKSGDDIFIEVAYEVMQSNIRSVAFRLQIVDANEQIFFTCNNEHSAGYFSGIEFTEKVRCHIPRLPLFGGQYFINLQIYSPEDGIFDEIEFAAELPVNDGDYFETGRIPGIKKGVLVAHRWDTVNGKIKFLVILGMHRSGTSLITQWLKNCGLSVGDSLHGADVGNAEGHF